MTELRGKFKELVGYLLDCERTTDNETIEAYTDSFMLGAEEEIGELMPYTGHLVNCNTNGSLGDCSCGLDNLLS
jgi:hypothetical protein